MIVNYKNRTNSTGKKEKSLVEILHIIYRRKYILILSVFTVAFLAGLYSIFTKPTYQAGVLVKKETAPDNNYSNEFYEIVRMQTPDEVETEMELVKTGEVLGKVVEELNLFLQFKRLVKSNGEELELDKTIVDYYNPKFNSKELPVPLPDFTSIDLKENEKAVDYYIKKVSTNEFSLFDAETDQLIQNSKTQPSVSDSNGINKENHYSTDTELKSTDFVEFKTPLALIRFTWSDAPVGSAFFFTIKSYHKTVVTFSKQISITRVSKTNVFKVSVKSLSPYAAALLANTVIEKFRESRIEQQKQTIRYSFAFVDDQLQEMQLKLREAEDNLSQFKASRQITTIDASSQEVVKFLSSLEAEKLKGQLRLSEYKNKIQDMNKELSSSGYFDQGFLSLESNTGGNDPFSSLLKQLSELELQRLELLQKRTENHPDVKNLNEQIKLAKQKLGSYNQNTLTAYQIIVNSLKKKLVDIANMMSKYEVKLEKLPMQENLLARLIREKDVYEQMFTLLLDKREEMRLAELSKLQDIILVDPAKEPLEPISPNKRLNVFIGLVLGAFIGIVSIFLIELKNSKLVNLDEIEEEFQIPILALIPNYDKDIVKRINNPADNKDRFVALMGDNLGIRESYRLLKTKLLYHLDSRENICLVTSCEENTGKTSIVANLAITLAKENEKVLIIDCDLRKAELSKMFDVPPGSPGLIDFITKGGSPAIYTRVLKKIDIIPAGGVREDSSSLLSSDQMKSLFKAIDTSVYNYIIIDTPPVTRVVDTLILGRYIKDAILVVRPNYSYNEAVWGGILEMLQAKIKIRGVVANAAEIKESHYYRYRYGYGYGYANGDKEKNSSKKKTKITQAAV